MFFYLFCCVIETKMVYLYCRGGDDMKKCTMRAIRVSNGSTLKETAEKLGISAMQLSRYERMLAVPSIATAMKFAKMFHEDVNDIIFFKEKVS